MHKWTCVRQPLLRFARNLPLESLAPRAFYSVPPPPLDCNHLPHVLLAAYPKTQPPTMHSPPDQIRPFQQDPEVGSLELAGDREEMVMGAHGMQLLSLPRASCKPTESGGEDDQVHKERDEG